MKIVRFIYANGQERIGKALSDETAELIDGDLFGAFETTGEQVRIGSLLAPVSPPNVYGIGLNYREHARNMGAEIPEFPPVFMKPTTTIAHPGEDILLPKLCTQGPEVDYECELAVVIGRRVRDISVADALKCVLGYTAANEVTARKWAKVSQIRGKSFDRFCPLGPAIVTADEIPDPQKLRLTTTLNGEVMQDGNTSDMIFSVAEIISFVSQDTTLLPGTVIVTGTPPGAGFARDPQVFLQDGDEVQVEIENIGKLSNPVAVANDQISNAA